MVPGSENCWNYSSNNRNDIKNGDDKKHQNQWQIYKMVEVTRNFQFIESTIGRSNASRPSQRINSKR